MILWLALGAALALAFAVPPLIIGRCAGLLYRLLTRERE